MVLIPSNLTLSPSANNQTATNLNRLLSIGQVLTAKIQPISSEQVKISIGNQNLIANTKQPIVESGTVQLKVKQVTPEIQLSLVANKTSSPAQQTSQTIQAAYRQFIPNQITLSNSFQQISLLQSLPPSLQTPVNQLLNQFAKQDYQGFNGKDLKNRIFNSGLFLESKLKNEASVQNVKQDLKAQLLQLQQQANRAQLSQHSDSVGKLSTILSQALSRITVQQIQLFENPLVTPFNLLNEAEDRVQEDYIEIHKRQQNDKQTWEVYVDLSLPEGEFASKLVLPEDENLQCFIWCDSPTLLEKIESRLPELQKLLENNNINQPLVQISAQKPSKAQQSIKVALIDIKI